MVAISQTRNFKYYLLRTLLVLAAVFIAVKVGLTLSVPPHYISPIWPVFALSVGLAYLLGLWTVFPMLISIFAGLYFHNYGTVEMLASPLMIALIACCGGGLLVLGKVLVLRKIFPDKSFLQYPREVALFLLVLVAISLLLFVILSLVSGFLNNVPGDVSSSVYIAWIGADLNASLILIPFVICLSDKYFRNTREGGYLEYFLLITVLISAIYFILFLEKDFAEKLSYFIIPFFFWIGFRYSMRDTTFALIVLAMIATFIFYRSVNYTFTGDSYYSLYLFQLYLFLISPVILLINAYSVKLRASLRRFISERNKIEKRSETLFNSKKLGINEQFDMFHAALESNPISIFVTDNKGNIEYVNPAFCKKSGYSKAEVIGGNARILNSGYHDEKFYKQMWDTLLSGNTWQGEIKNKRKDGSSIWEEVTIAPLSFGNEISRFICNKVDITQQKEALDTLKTSEERFRLLAENSPVVIIHVDGNGQIKYINQGTADRRPEQLLGKSVYDILNEEYHALARENLALSFKGHLSTSFQIKQNRKGDNYKFYEVLIAPMQKIGEVSSAILILQDITELIRSRERILENDKKYRLLAENVDDLIWVMDKNLRFTFLSPSVVNITGYTEEEVLSLHLRSIMPNIPLRLITEINKLRKNEINDFLLLPDLKWEKELIRKSGERIWLESKIKPIFTDRKKFDGLIGVSRDITMWKKSETALRLSEEKFRTFYENTKAIILLIDPKTAIIESANKAALNFYGFDSEDFGKLSFGEISQLSEAMVEEFIENILSGKRRTFSMQHLVGNKNAKEVEVLPTPVHIEDRTLLFTIVQDITRRKKAIAALKDSESKKLALLKIIPDLIFIVNKQGNILDVYTDKPSILLTSPDKMLGKNLVDVVAPEMGNKFMDTINQTFIDRKVKSFEYSFVRKKERQYEEARFIVSGEDELLIIFRDISVLKRSELELKHAWEEAKRANSSKSVFLANMSHEIRTPINAIIGFTELLTKELSDPVLERYTASIKSSSKTLLSLIEDILDISKIEAGKLIIKPEPANLKSIMGEVRDLFLLKREEKNIDFTINVPDSLPDILYLDELRVRQILINLIGNAMKFTEKGFVTVEVFANRQIMSGKRSFIDLQIDVSDSGIGIAKEFQSQIFEVFKQQDEQDSRKYEGTGLGLAITSRLVDLMDGSITVQSELGKGSRFTVKLPHIASGTELEPIKKSKKQRSNKVYFKDARVLIADDVETNRALLKGVINGENLQFYEAADGKEAIEIIENKPVDVILLDLNMPKASGFVVAEFIRTHKKFESIVIIAISATLISPAELHRAKYFDYFLPKPISVKELILILTKYLTHYKQETKKEGKQDNSITGTEMGDRLFVSDKKVFRKIEELREGLIRVKESSSFNEIKSYAREIKEISKLNKHDDFVNVAGQIEDAADNFDIEEIQKQFVKLAAILNNIEYENRD